MKSIISAGIATVLALTASSAFAYIDLGLDETVGTHKYSGTAGYFTVGQEDGLYLMPKFSTYHSDITNGAYSTYGGRLGYDQSVFSLGGEVNVTPKVNGYQKISTGGDITFTLTPTSGPRHRFAGPGSDFSSPSGSGIGRVDIGGGITYVDHREDVPPGGASTNLFRIGETKYTAFGGAQIFILNVSGQIVKSLYDGAFSAGAFGDRALQLPGVMPEVQGFPDTTWNAKVGLNTFLLKPYVSYTHTTFQLHQPTSNAYVLGASFGFGLVSVHGAYTVYDPGVGAIKQHYATAGATLNF